MKNQILFVLVLLLSASVAPALLWLVLSWWGVL
jgi:hypothetical protein